MDKQLFVNVYRNRLIRDIIVKDIHWIHACVLGCKRVYNWAKMSKMPQVLARYCYFDLVKQYFNHQYQFVDSEAKLIRATLKELIFVGNLELFSFMMCDVLRPHLESIYSPSFQDKDLLYYASKAGRIDFLEFLNELEVTLGFNSASSRRRRCLTWSHTDAFDISPYCGDIEVVKWTLNKVKRVEGLSDTSQIRLDRALWNASVLGHLDMIEYLEPDAKYHQEIVNGALEGGHMDILFWADKGDANLKFMLSKVVASGNIEMLNYINKTPERIRVDCPDVWSIAVTQGHIEVLNWLKNNMPHLLCSTNTFDQAIKEGDMEIVDWLFTNRTEGCTDNAFNSAVKNNDLKMLKYLRLKCKVTVSDSAAEYAVSNNYSEMVEWITRNIHGVTMRNSLDIAAHNFNLEMVMALHDNGIRCSTRAMNSAARGSFAIVKFLHENRTEGCTDLAMHNAAVSGNMDIIEYLHCNRSEGCRENTFNETAATGNLKMVQWLHNHHGHLSSLSAIDLAATGGHLETIKWLRENRSEKCTLLAMNNAISHGHLEVAQYLHSELNINTCSDLSLYEAISKMYFNVVEWALPAFKLKKDVYIKFCNTTLNFIALEKLKEIN